MQIVKYIWKQINTGRPKVLLTCNTNRLTIYKSNFWVSLYLKYMFIVNSKLYLCLSFLVWDSDYFTLMPECSNLLLLWICEIICTANDGDMKWKNWINILNLNRLLHKVSMIFAKKLLIEYFSLVSIIFSLKLVFFQNSHFGTLCMKIFHDFEAT